MTAAARHLRLRSFVGRRGHGGRGPLSMRDVIERFATHFHATEESAGQSFKGTWKISPEEVRVSASNPANAIELKVAGGL